MKPSVTVKQTLDTAAQVRKAMAALTKNDVYIGIPAEKAGREAAAVTMPALATYMNTAARRRAFRRVRTLYPALRT